MILLGGSIHVDIDHVQRKRKLFSPGTPGRGKCGVSKENTKSEQNVAAQAATWRQKQQWRKHKPFSNDFFFKAKGGGRW